jgi:hypothetical protein
MLALVTTNHRWSTIMNPAAVRILVLIPHCILIIILLLALLVEEAICVRAFITSLLLLLPPPFATILEPNNVPRWDPETKIRIGHLAKYIRSIALAFQWGDKGLAECTPSFSEA